MLGYLLLGLLAHGSAENATVYQLTDLDLWCIVARPCLTEQGLHFGH